MSKKRNKRYQSSKSKARNKPVFDSSAKGSASSQKATRKKMPVNAMRIFAAEQALADRMISKEGFTADSFVNFANRIGVGNGAHNDNTLSEGFYEFNLVTRNRIKLEAGYRGNWVIGGIVDYIAEDMTKYPVEITTTDGKADVVDIQSELNRLKIRETLCDNIKWGRLYGGSIGVIQIEGQDPSTPLRLETIAEGQFKGIAVYDRWQVNPVINDIIETGPDMGLPKFYQIVSSPVQVQPSVDAIESGIVTVHHSRVLRSIGIKLPFFQAITEQMWGESVLERPWDRIISFDNVTMSSASLVDRANLRTVGIKDLRQVISAGGDALKGMYEYFDMMREAQNNMGLTLLDELDDFQATSYTFSGLADMILQFAQQLSGATTIPLVRFFGQSPSGLNATGEQDLRLYYDGINTRQESELHGAWDLILRCTWRSL